MGLKDKLQKAVDTAKDFLDDGKINGSVKKADEPAPEPVAPEKPEPAQEPAPALSPDNPKEFQFNFGSPFPVPYNDGGRMVNVRYAGRFSIQSLEGLKDSVGQIVKQTLVSAMAEEIGKLSAEQVPAAQLQGRSTAMTAAAAETVKARVPTADLISVTIVNISVSGE